MNVKALRHLICALTVTVPALPLSAGAALIFVSSTASPTAKGPPSHALRFVALRARTPLAAVATVAPKANEPRASARTRPRRRLGASGLDAMPPDSAAFRSEVYFTPFCDVVLRFESLKRDFDGLMAKIGCPLRIPPARENRGNRLVPLLADDVVASVRRMYAEDYALVERLAGFDLDELLANATGA